MFIRVKTTKNSPRKSVQIVEGVRDHTGKVKQRIVRHIGIAQDDDELERLKDLAEYVKTKIIAEHTPYFLPPEEVAEIAIEARKKRTDQNKPTPIDDIALLTEEQTSIIGIHEVYGTIYDQLGFSQVIPKLCVFIKKLVGGVDIFEGGNKFCFFVFSTAQPLYNIMLLIIWSFLKQHCR